jgi:predicted RNA binding protein YcfA (HicA-like mRNA interferase family)
MTPRLRTLKPRDMIHILQRAGFEVDHQTGSHVVMHRLTDSCRVVVPWHSRDLGRGLTLRILKTADLSQDDAASLLG